MMNDIESYFQHRGWQFEQIDAQTIASGFTSALPSGERHSFPLYAMAIGDMMGDSFMRLVIVPYIERPADGYSSRLMESLSRINHDLPVAKLALDADGDLEMLIDIPATELTQPRFDAALQLLADHAGLYYEQIAALI